MRPCFGFWLIQTYPFVPEEASWSLVEADFLADLSLVQGPPIFQSFFPIFASCHNSCMSVKKVDVLRIIWNPKTD